MPKRVDHEQRRRHIADAVIRITTKGGLNAATFREVAAEAGVSVNLVQYYFGTKDELLLATQRYVAEKSTQRLRRHVADAGDDPRSALMAVLTSFIPTDDESREAMLMFVALHTASLLDPTLARREAKAVPRALERLVAHQLRQLPIRRGLDCDKEAAILVALVPTLGQAVLDQSYSPDQATELIEYALQRLLRPATQP